MNDNQKEKIFVIVLHGFASNINLFNSLKNTILKVYPAATIVIPKLPLAVFSHTNLNIIVDQLLNKIDEAFDKLNAAHQQACKIIIVGHSTGALLARKLYVCACGENEVAPFEEEIKNKQTRKWAKNVERLVLFAGINKGWTINPHLSLTKIAAIRAAIFVGKIMMLFGYQPVGFSTKKGATFITQLRLQSLAMIDKVAEKKVGDALIIQLLGTRDDIVSPEDDVDLVTGSKYVYLEVPNSGHIDVIDMTGRYGAKREQVAINALTLTKEELKAFEVIPGDFYTIQQDPTITDVIFVIHGIRDTGYWTQKIARRVKKLGDSAGKRFAMETSTYGYFAMLPFMFSSSRRSKVEWLMDQYTEDKAMYPNAEFSFIGHSNGTYLLAKALEEYPACRFKNIILAGSVVNKNYNWKKLKDAGRVKNVFNFVATNDWVVSIFPKTFQTLSIQDLGSGGYDGFYNLDDNVQFKFIHGGHAAALKESVWDEMAHLIVKESFSQPAYLEKATRSWQMKLVSFLSPFIFLLCIASIITGGLLIIIFIKEPTLRLVLLACYIYLMYKILTWF